MYGSTNWGLQNVGKYLGLNESFYYKIFYNIFLFSTLSNITFASLIISFSSKESYLFYLLILTNKIVIFISIIIAFLVFKDSYKKAVIKKYGIFLLIFFLIMIIIGISIPSIII